MKDTVKFFAQIKQPKFTLFNNTVYMYMYCSYKHFEM